MKKEKTPRQSLDEAMVEAARKEGIPVLEPVVIQFDPQVHQDVQNYLDNLHRFEQASRKVNIRVGGDGCGYCRRAREMQRAY